MFSQFRLWSDLLFGNHLRCTESDRSNNIICLNSSQDCLVQDCTTYSSLGGLVLEI